MPTIEEKPVSPSSRPAAVVILAAGQGTRMRSSLPKVLHEVCGRSMIGHVLSAAADLAPERLVVVVGQGRDEVSAHVRDLVPEALIAVQEPQEGTGHAVRVAMDALASGGSPSGTVVVMAADTPLIESATLASLVGDHGSHDRSLTVLTSTVEDAHGYGRIVRTTDGALAAIVEEKDATAEQRAIREINSGIFAFDGDFLLDALGRLTNTNANGEYYLTDLVEIAAKDGRSSAPFWFSDSAQTEGANDRAQLAALGAELNRRILQRWMRDGVTVVDPATTWVDVTVGLAADVTIKPGVQLHGTTTVEQGGVVGPDCTLTDVRIGAGASVVRTHGSDSEIGEGATVGPFAYLRPGTRLGARGKIGTFVETKNATIGDGAKVPHLSYVGDAEIGEGTNIGAGTIVANYDGVSKHRTVVGRHARTGSNNTFVAPVEIGDGAVTGGGTVVRRDVPAGALAVSGGPQRHFKDWVERKRAGSPAAEAARAAKQGHETSQDEVSVAHDPQAEGQSQAPAAERGDPA